MIPPSQRCVSSCSPISHDIYNRAVLYFITILYKYLETHSILLVQIAVQCITFNALK